MAIVMLTIFPHEVNSLDHPEVVRLRTLLQDGVAMYGGKLTSFAIEHGVVFFGIDNEEMARDMLDDAGRVLGVAPHIFPDEAAFAATAKKLLDERRSGT